MRMDKSLLRKLLLQAENMSEVKPENEIEGAHWELLREGDFIDCELMARADDGKVVKVMDIRIKYKGHEFLSLFGSCEEWEKVKEYAQSKGFDYDLSDAPMDLLPTILHKAKSELANKKLYNEIKLKVDGKTL